MKQSDMLKLLLSLDDRVNRLESIVEGVPEKTARVEPTIERKAPKKRTQTAKKKPEPKADDFHLDLSKLEDMSNTELVSSCRASGHIHASRAMHRNDLEALLIGEPIEVEDPLVEIRETTYAFVQGNSSILKSVMKCDLHCPTCPHNKVIECWATNHDIVIKE